MTLVEFAVLRELLIWDSDTVCPLSTVLTAVLTAVLRLVVEDIAPLKELLIWESEVLWLLSTVLTAVLRLVVEEMAPLREELIWESEVLVPAPPPTAVLSESILELAELIEPLMTVLTAVLRLDVEEMAPLRELLI